MQIQHRFLPWVRYILEWFIGQCYMSSTNKRNIPLKMVRHQGWTVMKWGVARDLCMIRYTSTIFSTHGTRTQIDPKRNVFCSSGYFGGFPYLAHASRQHKSTFMCSFISTLTFNTCSMCSLWSKRFLLSVIIPSTLFICGSSNSSEMDETKEKSASNDVRDPKPLSQSN